MENRLTMLLFAFALPAWSTVHAAAPPALDLKVEQIDAPDGGRAYQIASSGTVAANPAAVWRVLTDYNHMADYVPDLTSAKIVSRNGDNIIIEQLGAARFFFFSHPIHLIVQVHEQAPNKIDVSLVDGDMKVYRCSWELVQAGADGGTRILYNATIEPKFYVPAMVGASLVRKDIGRMMSAVMARLDRDGQAR